MLLTCSPFKVDRESYYCAFLLRIKIIQIALLLLLVYIIYHLVYVLMDLAIKDVRGWQFLTMKAAETLCIVCLPPEEHIS